MSKPKPFPFTCSDQRYAIFALFLKKSQINISLLTDILQDTYQSSLLKEHAQFKKKIHLFIYLFLAALGLRCCARAFSSCGEQGLLFVAVHGLLICGGFSCCGARPLGTQASVVASHGPSCSAACGIFPDQGSNPCPLHWQADS